MNNEKKEVNEEEKASEISKGTRLRLAREAKGWEVSEAAVKLYFETRFIIALENDDYSIFAGSAYLYGYMRAYVKLLGLSLDEFVSDLENIEDENETHFEKILYEPSVKQKSRKWILPALAGVIIAIIMAAVFLLYNGDSAEPDTLTFLSNEGEQSGQASHQISIPLSGEDTGQPVVMDEKTTSGGTTQKLALSPNAASKPADPRLLLEYKSDSWTDIRDAKGKRLVYRMVEKGHRLELDSSPSYSILLGYSPGVEISWNDQPFSLAKYESDNTAYFVVGKGSKTGSGSH